MSTPTQKMREAFEDWRNAMPLSNALATPEEIWQAAWQSAHQSGREEERERCVTLADQHVRNVHDKATLIEAIKDDEEV